MTAWNSVLPKRMYCQYTDGKYASESLQLLAKYMPLIDSKIALENRTTVDCTKDLLSIPINNGSKTNRSNETATDRGRAKTQSIDRRARRNHSESPWAMEPERSRKTSAYIFNDIIGHTSRPSSPTNNTSPALRQYRQPLKDYDPITHLRIKPVSRQRAVSTEAIRPSVQLVKSQPIVEGRPSLKTSESQDIAVKKQPTSTNTSAQKFRNIITGDGLKPNEYLTTQAVRRRQVRERRATITSSPTVRSSMAAPLQTSTVRRYPPTSASLRSSYDQSTRTRRLVPTYSHEQRSKVSDQVEEEKPVGECLTICHEM